MGLDKTPLQYDNRFMSNTHDTTSRYHTDTKSPNPTSIDVLSSISERLLHLERTLAVLADRLGPVPEQLSRAEAARYAGVSEATIDRWRAMGRLTRLTHPSRVWLAELRACVTGKIPDSMTLISPSGFAQITDPAQL